MLDHHLPGPPPARPLRLSLITLGDPGQPTGGYLYHRRLAQAAPLNGAAVSFVSVPDAPFPLPVATGAGVLAQSCAGADAVLVDSIAAAYVAPAAAWRRCRVPLVGILHQPPGGLESGPLRRYLQGHLDMALYRRADLLVVASQLLAENLVERGLPWERLRVVPPGRDGAQPGPAAPNPGDLRCGCATAFLCVANWLAHKGLHTLLEAFAMLPRQAGTLHLVGNPEADPGYAHQLRSRLERPDLQGRVVVHGWLPAREVAALYQAADVFVLPARHETYGTVYGEAMAAGLPVVGVRAGNLPHLVTPGVEGLIVDPDDVPGLARALLRLAEDEGLRRTMGEAARLRALAWPTWAESAAAFFAAVREVVDV